METTIWIIWYAKDFYRYVWKNNLKWYTHIYSEDSWRWKRFSDLLIVSEYSSRFADLKEDAKYNLIKK